MEKQKWLEYQIIKRKTKATKEEKTLVANSHGSHRYIRVKKVAQMG